MTLLPVSTREPFQKANLMQKRLIQAEQVHSYGSMYNAPGATIP